MSVKMLVGPPAYNKAPVPAKTPNEKVFPITAMIDGDQPVWISVPVPDKLHLNVRLSPDHFISAYSPEDPYEYGRMVMHALASGQAGPVLKNKYVKEAHLSTEVLIDLAGLGQPMFFKLTKTKKDSDGPHTLSIQMNPAKLGEQGCYEFLDQLYQATAKRLWVGRMLADARISRLDAAVDIVGVQIADLLVSVDGAGKQSFWRTAEGDLETIDFYRIKKKKTGALVLGDLLAIAYDKRAERIAAGFPPPHEPAPVTRIEVSKNRFGNKPFLLTNLLDVPNPFKPVRVGLVRSAQTPLTRQFVRYVAARRIHSAKTVAGMLYLTTHEAEKFETALENHPSDLIDGAAIWKYWPEGIQQTGTSLLIEAASEKSAAVPYPNFE